MKAQDKIYNAYVVGLIPNWVVATCIWRIARNGAQHVNTKGQQPINTDIDFRFVKQVWNGLNNDAVTDYFWWSLSPRLVSYPLWCLLPVFRFLRVNRDKE